MNGRPLDLRWAAEHVPAILDIWYPGTRGGEAVANLLFGDVSPGGKLPFTWPRTVGQVPMIYSHTRSHEPENQGAPLLGRGRHPAVPVRPRPQLRALRVHQPRHRSAGEHDAWTPSPCRSISPTPPTGKPTRWSSSTSTSDTGRRHDRGANSRASNGSRSRPASRARCEFLLGPDERRYWSAAVRDWVTDASTFDVWVGGDSTAPLSTTFEVHLAVAEVGRIGLPPTDRSQTGGSAR